MSYMVFRPLSCPEHLPGAPESSLSLYSLEESSLRVGRVFKDFFLSGAHTSCGARTVGSLSGSVAN